MYIGIAKLLATFIWQTPTHAITRTRYKYLVLYKETTFVTSTQIKTMSSIAHIYFRVELAGVFSL